eukprot:420633-Prymnesium_polylepis.1
MVGRNCTYLAAFSAPKPDLIIVARGRVGRVGRVGRSGTCELVHSHIAQIVSTAKILRECCWRVGRVGEEGMPSRTV